MFSDSSRFVAYVLVTFSFRRVILSDQPKPDARRESGVTSTIRLTLFPIDHVQHKYSDLHTTLVVYDWFLLISMEVYFYSHKRSPPLSPSSPSPSLFPIPSSITHSPQGPPNGLSL